MCAHHSKLPLVCRRGSKVEGHIEPAAAASEGLQCNLKHKAVMSEFGTHNYQASFIPVGYGVDLI